MFTMLAMCQFSDALLDVLLMDVPVYGVIGCLYMIAVVYMLVRCIKVSAIVQCINCRNATNSNKNS